MEKDRVKKIVATHYRTIAQRGGCCGGGCGCKKKSQHEDIAKRIGYTDEDLHAAGDANLGLGCGNPTALGAIREGETVLDLGSGAGFDCFLAAKKVGLSGTVIGVDMTEEMVAQATKNAAALGLSNVVFARGDIERIPLEDQAVDVVISNCVINLAPDKAKVFQEAYRVLKPGGRMYVSDIVLLATLTDAQKNNESLIAGCVGGAVLKEEYIRAMQDAGFAVRILSEDTQISKEQYHGVPLESLKVEGIKS